MHREIHVGSRFRIDAKKFAIETGKVAPRFNTLLDLVRILGFDLLLVPRPLVPAVQSLVRDSAHPGSRDTAEDERPLYTKDGEETDEP